MLSAQSPICNVTIIRDARYNLSKTILSVADSWQYSWPVHGATSIYLKIGCNIQKIKKKKIC